MSVATPLLVIGWLLFTGGVQAASPDELQRAKEAYEEGRFEAARSAYQSLLRQQVLPGRKDGLSYGLGATQFQLKDYDAAVRAFSDAARSGNRDLQKRALRGLGTALYNQGDLALARQPEYTVRAWTDALNHFDTALDMDQDNAELKANRDFIQKRLDELKKQMAQSQQQDQNQQQQQGKGQGKQDPKQQENGEGQEPQDGQPEEQRQTDAMEQQSGDLPEGEIRAGEAGKPDEKNQGEAKEPVDDNKMNEKTGFTPQEARNQLRNYANDQQSVQYLQRREPPHGGKDY